MLLEVGFSVRVLFLCKYATENGNWVPGYRAYGLSKMISNLDCKIKLIHADPITYGNPDRGVRRERNLGNFCDLQVSTLGFRKNMSIRRILSWLEFEVKSILNSKVQGSKPDVVIVSSFADNYVHFWNSVKGFL